MKKVKKYLVISILISGVTLSSCIPPLCCIRGNGNVVTENRSISSFSKIDMNGSFDVYVSLDSFNSVVVEAESNLLPYIYTKVNGSRLEIKTRDHQCLKKHKPVKVFVTTTGFNEINLSGSGSIIMDEMLEVNSFYAKISGSGDIEAALNTNIVETDISGSGEIKLSGNATETDFHISGSGEIRADNLEHEKCFTSISGSGDVYTFVNDFLDVQISGSGDVYYLGNPSVNSRVSGSGRIVNLN